MATADPVTTFTETMNESSVYKTVDDPVPQIVNMGGQLMEAINKPITTLSNLPDLKPTEIQFEQDPAGYIHKRVVSLIYWETPARSAAVLGLLLFVLRMTQYYSLLHLTAATFTMVTSLNFVYVNTHKQSQRVFGGRSCDQLTNPHSARLKTKQTLFPRDKVAHAAKLMVDVVEVAVQQVSRLVLIENNWNSGIALVVSYLVWTLAAYIATKHLITVFLLGAFSIPPIYHKHQVVIDKHIAQYSYQARGLALQYGNLAVEKTKVVYSQAMDALVKKAPLPQKTD